MGIFLKYVRAKKGILRNTNRSSLKALFFQLQIDTSISSILKHRKHNA